MDKENSKSAAGLRRSAVAERIRLQKEWSALKGTSDNAGPLRTTNKRPITNSVNKRIQSRNIGMDKKNLAQECVNRNHLKIVFENKKRMDVTSEALRGIVALVDVGSEPRALALRAALTALGATVFPSWSPLVTHLIWSQGGDRNTRARARALACGLVSPLWVEACAAAGKKLPEVAFPAAPRPSDLPSPRTLRHLLKRAEMENIPLTDLLSDSKEDEKDKAPRLRISSDNDSSLDKTNTSHDTSNDKFHDESKTGANTAQRRVSPRGAADHHRPTKSRRKLFTQKEAQELTGITDQSEEESAVPKRMQSSKLTQRDKKDLARAERIARKIVAASTPAKLTLRISNEQTYRIVLTGMGKTERQTVTKAIKELNGKIQNTVSKKTTHVLLGSFQETDIRSNVTAMPREAIDVVSDITGITSHEALGIKSEAMPREAMIANGKPRTLNALFGAARGCRVLYAQWILHCAKEKRWLHHNGYEVPYLKKMCQKARVERKALNKLRCEYAYDVFCGMRVKISPNAEQKDGVTQLLTLCGAVIVEDHRQNVKITQRSGTCQNNKKLSPLTQNGGFSANTQNGRFPAGTQGGRFPANTQNCGSQPNFDITIGIEPGEVNSKWVFDSVASARMRTTRRYCI